MITFPTTPGTFIAYQERLIGRELTDRKREVMAAWVERFNLSYPGRKSGNQGTAVIRIRYPCHSQDDRLCPGHRCKRAQARYTATKERERQGARLLAKARTGGLQGQQSGLTPTKESGALHPVHPLGEPAGMRTQVVPGRLLRLRKTPPPV